jgi:hypothetical protein
MQAAENGALEDYIINSTEVGRDYYILPEGGDNWIPILQIPELQVSKLPLVNTQNKLRHGFTSFWLWLCVIANGAGGLILLYSYG